MKHLRSLQAGIKELHGRGSGLAFLWSRSAAAMHLGPSSVSHSGSPSCSGTSPDRHLSPASTASCEPASTSSPSGLPLPSSPSLSAPEPQAGEWMRPSSCKSLQPIPGLSSRSLPQEWRTSTCLDVAVSRLPGGSVLLGDSAAADGFFRPLFPWSASASPSAAGTTPTGMSWRTFSTAVSSDASDSTNEDDDDDISIELPEEETRKPGGRRSQKNLFQVLRLMPNWGVGAKVAKTQWKEGNFYTITKVEPKKHKSGTAWGIYHTKGEPATGKEEKIGGTNKREWKEVREVSPESQWKIL